MNVVACVRCVACARACESRLPPWCVFYSTNAHASVQKADVRFDSDAADDDTCDTLYDAQRDGRVWCVNVAHPDNLIIYQRAHIDTDGTVTKASRPVIIGNCDLYPLDELDLAIPVAGEDQARPGALELIMNEGNVALLMHPRMIDLVSQKWSKFAQRIFKQRFCIVLAYLALFTITTIVRQTVHHIYQKEDLLVLNGSLPTDESGGAYIPWAWFIYQYPFLLWSMELLVLFGAWYKGSAEFTEMYRSGVREYFSSSGSALLENSLSCIFCGCIFIVFLLTLVGSPAQSAVLAMASIAGWSYIFFFLLAFRLTGPMVVMIHQMLTNDVLRFCLIYLVFLMGFAQAFFVLFESVGVSGFVISVKTCFVAMLGDFELDQFADTPYTAVSVGLLVVYVVTITILLLNLLIAMMGDTYEKINAHAIDMWHLERARIIFAIENELSAEERLAPVNKYWTTVEGQRFLQVLEVNPNHFKTEGKQEQAEEE